MKRVGATAVKAHIDTKETYLNALSDDGRAYTCHTSSYQYDPTGSRTCTGVT